MTLSGLVKIQYCDFVGNSVRSSNFGGAIYVNVPRLILDPISISESTFSNNKGGKGGAIFNANQNCIIEG